MGAARPWPQVRSEPAAMTVTQDPDEMWPKRRKSDLVVRPGAQYGMGPYTQKRAQKAPEAPAAPTSVPIRIIRSRTPSAPQDPMWPRRKKSDLMIYQETRIPKKSDADLFYSERERENIWH